MLLLTEDTYGVAADLQGIELRTSTPLLVSEEPEKLTAVLREYVQRRTAETNGSVVWNGNRATVTHQRDGFTNYQIREVGKL